MVATVHKNVNLKFNIKMNIVKCFVILFLFISTNANSVSRTKCSALCMCDIHDGMRRTSCNHRFIVDVNLIIPNNVQIYDVSYNSISKLDDFCFRNPNFKSIIELNLSENTIFWIGLHAFSGLPFLKNLNLRHNRLEGIPPDLFYYNPLLEEVDFSENKFLSIADQPFISHRNLRTLKLRHSQISFLPANVFTELPNLINLDISGNNLIELHIPLFLKLNKLTHLILDENEWQCNEKFKEFQSWIKQRDIQFDLQCEYTEGQEHMFEKIISLVNEDSDENELPEFWEHSSEIIPNENINDNISTSDTAIQLFHLYDTTFPSSWSLLLGLQIGGLFGALITYCCMSGLCSCKSIKLVSRRQRIREARLHLQEGRELLLSVIHANVETPPVARRQLSNDGAFCRTYSWEAGSDQNPNNISSNDNNQPSDLRSETPPPAYTTCIDDIILTPK